MPAPGRRHVEPADLGIEQVLHGGRELLARLRIAREQLLAVHDLQHALGAGAVGEVDAVLVRDGPVHALGRGAGRARLLAGQPEVADEARLRGIAQVVDLGHPVGAPAARRAVGDEVGDAGVALPPVLVRALEPVQHRGEQRGLRRIGHVPDLVRQIAERAQEIGLLARPARQRLAVADARHRRAARLRLARRAGDVVQVLRLLRIRHVHDGGAVLLHLAGQRVHAQAAVVADVGDDSGRPAGGSRAGRRSAPADRGRPPGACRAARRPAPASGRAPAGPSGGRFATRSRPGLRRHRRPLRVAAPQPTRAPRGAVNSNPRAPLPPAAAGRRRLAAGGLQSRHGRAAPESRTIRGGSTPTGNLLGAIVAFLYFRVVDSTRPADAAGRPPRGRASRSSSSPRSSAIGQLVQPAVGGGSLSALGRAAGLPPPEAAAGPPAGAALSVLPRRAHASSAGCWPGSSGASCCRFSTAASLAQSSRQVFGITVIAGGVTTAFIFFASEHAWRRRLPVFFPEGDLRAVPRRPRLAVRSGCSPSSC